MSAAAALALLGLGWEDLQAMRADLLAALRCTVDGLLVDGEWDRP